MAVSAVVLSMSTHLAAVETERGPLSVRDRVLLDLQIVSACRAMAHRQPDHVSTAALDAALQAAVASRTALPVPLHRVRALRHAWQAHGGLEVSAVGIHVRSLDRLSPVPSLGGGGEPEDRLIDQTGVEAGSEVQQRVVGG